MMQDMPQTSPDIQFGPLTLWVHGYEYPEPRAFWDANWLVVSATLATDFSQSWIRRSSCWRTEELDNFLYSIDEMLGSVLHSRRSANFYTIESQISWEVEKLNRNTEYIQIHFEFSGDIGNENHTVTISVSASELTEFLNQCRIILKHSPVGKKEGPFL